MQYSDYRYTVVGRSWDAECLFYRHRPIYATNDLGRAREVCATGDEYDGEHWPGVRIHDRETATVLR